MSAVIFDFDGTIADSFEMVISIFYDLSGRHEALPPDEIERLRGMSLVHAAEDLHIPPWKMPFLVMRGRRRMSKRMSGIQAHKGVPGVIDKLFAEGHQLFIVSSNSKKNIKLFLKQHHINKMFVSIYGGVGLLNKSRVLKKVVRQNSLDPKDTWYIGDEVRDITAAQQAGLRIIAVSWGYNNAAILDQHGPTELVQTPDDIIRIFE